MLFHLWEECNSSQVMIGTLQLDTICDTMLVLRLMHIKIKNNLQCFGSYVDDHTKQLVNVYVSAIKKR